MSELLVSEQGPIRRLRLNRAERRNALSPGLIGELQVALDQIGTARLLLLEASGPAFCAGMDLKALEAQGGLMPAADLARLFRTLYELPCPTIALVQGPALAGGCGLATLCDFTLATPDARFGYPEVGLGIVPALVSVFLVRQLGERRARELLLSGRIVSAEEALAWGWIQAVVPAEELPGRAAELAQRLLRNSPRAMAATKRLLAALPLYSMEAALAAAESAHAAQRDNPDFREGLAAYRDKRSPQWK